ncbi:hypothetical protein JZ785_25640 [Alicyclobacillus curvatus]|nr:hypothetical protein JZ785_25640 [Alicyclobacillus curvatus]
MGQFVSALAKDIEAVSGSIAKLVTDAGQAVAQLGTMTAGFAGPVPQTPEDGTVMTILFAAGDDVQTALKAALTSAEKASSSLFSKRFGDVDPAGTDKGVVNGYKPDGDMSTVFSQMKQDFENWNLAVDDKIMNQMANTIAQQVKAQMGLAGTSYGSVYLNLNQKIDWTVAYGMFQVTPSSQGLVYAFSAALDGGW